MEIWRVLRWALRRNYPWVRHHLSWKIRHRWATNSRSQGAMRRLVLPLLWLGSMLLLLRQWLRCLDYVGQHKIIRMCCVCCHTSWRLQRLRYRCCKRVLPNRTRAIRSYDDQRGRWLDDWRYANGCHQQPSTSSYSFGGNCNDIKHVSFISKEYSCKLNMINWPKTNSFHINNLTVIIFIS